MEHTRNKMSELTLENEYLKVTFSGAGPGFSGIWAKNYNPGSAIASEYNRLDENLWPKVIQGDYHGIYVNGAEYWGGNLNWIAYKTTMSSRDLYGKEDVYGNIMIDVIKVVSGDIVGIGQDREINSQELIYYFTPDGAGLIKRVRLNVRKSGELAGNLASLTFMNYAGFSPVSYGGDVKYSAFGEKFLGFDTLTGWSADQGLTLSLARANLYPNLLPGFTDNEWIAESGSPFVIDDSHMNLSSGDCAYICHQNAYPANRIHTLTLSVQNLTGILRVKYGLSQGAIAAQDEAEILEINANGTYAMQVNSGWGDNWLFLKLEQLSGSCQVYDPAVKYLKSGATYSAYQNDHLANTTLRNCAGITSSNPQNLRLIYNFPSNVKIAQGKGIKLMALSLDNTSIEDGAFRIIFQKPDNSWVESGDVNMFVDYNDKYPLGEWGRFNLWEDSFFGVEIPAGVDEIKAIGIKWITGTAIDWLLDGFGVMVWEDNDPGIGSTINKQMGLPASGLRMRDFILRGAQGAYHEADTHIPNERLSVIVVGGPQGYGEYVPLTFQNVSAINEVYQIDNAQYIDTNWSGWQDEGYRLTYDASGISNYLYPISVRNLTQGENYTIISASGDAITVDTTEKNYSLTDTLRITYAKKITVDPANWSLAQNGFGQWCVKWGYTAWTIIHDREAVYVDYTVSSRNDDTLSCIVCSSNHDTNRIIQQYPDITSSSAQLANYSTLVFSDPSNELAEGIFVYKPLLNTSGEALYTEAQNVQDLADALYANSRPQLLTPLPRNYNFMPMLAFGGENIASNPIAYLQQASSKFFEANATNTILAGGSMDYLYDRDMDRWWSWSGGLRDSGVNYLTAGRNILRRGYLDNDISKNLNRHRYLLELTVFAEEHTKRHKDQAAIDYKGNTAYYRIWYYQAQDGSYTVVQRNWDDFASQYYDPVEEGGKTYDFQYHYILVIPAFWSVVKPSSYWGINTPAIYDMLMRRIDYLCQNYDTDGVIVSELLYYEYSFNDKDFTLYNQWRQNVKGWLAAADWPRDSVTGYVLIDDPIIWEFKSYFIKEMLTQAAAVAHSHNKLLGANVEVQNCLPVAQANASVWDSYDKVTGKYGTCVDTLDYSCDRYGTPYSELLKEDICDLFFVWLYYRYSPFGVGAVYDFMARFAAYKERMLVTIGLFPREDPPAKEEIITLCRELLKAGFNVVYAGYPDMLIEDERWVDVWGAMFNYVPLVRWLGPDQIEVNPRQVDEVSFLARF